MRRFSIHVGGALLLLLVATGCGGAETAARDTSEPSSEPSSEQTAATTEEPTGSPAPEEEPDAAEEAAFPASRPGLAPATLGDFEGMCAKVDRRLAKKATGPQISKDKSYAPGDNEGGASFMNHTCLIEGAKGQVYVDGVVGDPTLTSARQQGVDNLSYTRCTTMRTEERFDQEGTCPQGSRTVYRALRLGQDDLLMCSVAVEGKPARATTVGREVCLDLLEKLT